MPLRAADAPGAAAPTILADVPQNQVWADTDRAAIVFQSGRGEPALVLNKAAFRRGPGEIYLDIETDARSFDFTSGSATMQLQVVNQKKYRLLLNGASGKETLSLNNKELVLQKAPWAEVMSDSGGKTFTIFFTGANEVKITFKPRDRAIKVR